MHRGFGAVPVQTASQFFDYLSMRRPMDMSRLITSYELVGRDRTFVRCLITFFFLVCTSGGAIASFVRLPNAVCDPSSQKRLKAPRTSPFIRCTPGAALLVGFRGSRASSIQKWGTASNYFAWATLVGRTHGRINISEIITKGCNCSSSLSTLNLQCRRGCRPVSSSASQCCGHSGRQLGAYQDGSECKWLWSTGDLHKSILKICNVVRVQLRRLVSCQYVGWKSTLTRIGSSPKTSFTAQFLLMLILYVIHLVYISPVILVVPYFLSRFLPYQLHAVHADSIVGFIAALAVAARLLCFTEVCSHKTKLKKTVEGMDEVTQSPLGGTWSRIKRLPWADQRGSTFRCITVALFLLVTFYLSGYVAVAVDIGLCIAAATRVIEPRADLHRAIQILAAHLSWVIVGSWALFRFIPGFFPTRRNNGFGRRGSALCRDSRFAELYPHIGTAISTAREELEKATETRRRGSDATRAMGENNSPREPKYSAVLESFNHFEKALDITESVLHSTLEFLPQSKRKGSGQDSGAIVRDNSSFLLNRRRVLSTSGGGGVSDCNRDRHLRTGCLDESLYTVGRTCKKSLLTTAELRRNLQVLLRDAKNCTDSRRADLSDHSPKIRRCTANLGESSWRPSELSKMSIAEKANAMFKTLQREIDQFITVVGLDKNRGNSDVGQCDACVIKGRDRIGSFGRWFSWRSRGAIRGGLWVWWAVGGYYLSCLCFNIADLISMNLIHMWSKTDSQAHRDEYLVSVLTDRSENSIMSLFTAAFAPCVSAPVWEELVYRGFCLPLLHRHMSLPFAMFVTSVLFSVHHLNIQTFLPLFSLGWAWAWLYVQSSNLIVPIFAHGMWNSRVFLSNLIRR